MTIKEAEAATGLERANIRFYEQLKLVVPERQENGYRNYTQEDIDILLKIRLLRSLHISLEEIGNLKNGSEHLAETLARQIIRLQQEQASAEKAQNICRQIQLDQVSFSELNAAKYLEQLSRQAKAPAASHDSYFSLESDTLPPMSCPWRRFLARFLDFSLYDTVFELGLFGLIFRLNLLRIPPFANYLITAMAALLMLVTEPLLLHVFGTTPGKALMGLRLEGTNGNKLSYREGLIRTGGVIRLGFGFWLPFYNLYRLWKCYRLCRSGKTLPWDEELDINYIRTRESVGILRGSLYILSHAVLIFLLVLVLLSQQLAPCRGSLTVAQFVENFYYFAGYNGYDFGNDFFDQDGQLQTAENGGSFIVYTTEHTLPQFTYTTKDGAITAVSFSVDIPDTDMWVEPFVPYQMYTALALAQANPAVGLFSKAAEKIAESMQAFRDLPQSYRFRAGGVEFSCELECENFIILERSGGLLIPDGDGPHRFYLRFTAQIYD